MKIAAICRTAFICCAIYSLIQPLLYREAVLLVQFCSSGARRSLYNVFKVAQSVGRKELARAWLSCRVLHGLLTERDGC